MRKGIIKLFGVMVIVAGILSCNRVDDVHITTQVEEKVLESTNAFNGQEVNQSSFAPQTYAVSPSLLAHFRHYCQRNAGPVTSNYPDGEGVVTSGTSQQICCPTSYMMAANCLSSYSGVGYDFSGNFLRYMVDTYTNSRYTYLFTMYQHANTVDNNLFFAIKSGPHPNKTNEPNRAVIKQFMQNALYNDCFVLVSLKASLKNFNVVNNPLLYVKDASNPDLTNYPSYISPNHGGGHVIVIIAIEVDNSGDGIVTYIDPLAKTRANGRSNKRYVRYSTLLNSMKASSSDNASYNAIAIGLN